MGFSDTVKLEVKKKAFFRCCICQDFGPLHIHHIIPQKDGGSNDIDNAAPLCVKCHDNYGNDQNKRKWIREKRDWWYDLVKSLTPSDNNEILNKIASDLDEIKKFIRKKLYHKNE